MIFYTDDPKNCKTTDVVMMRFFNAKTKAKNWNSDRYIDVIDVELFAIDKAIEFCAKRAYLIKIASNIWIFIDWANAHTRLKNFEFRTHLMSKMHRNCKKLHKMSYKIYIHWISKYAKISRNLQADEQTKKRFKKIQN